MKRASIYFEGKLINSVEFEAIKPDELRNRVLLVVFENDTHKAVAIVPDSHLIIIKDL